MYLLKISLKHVPQLIQLAFSTFPCMTVFSCKNMWNLSKSILVLFFWVQMFETFSVGFQINEPVW